MPISEVPEPDPTSIGRATAAVNYGELPSDRSRHPDVAEEIDLKRAPETSVLDGAPAIFRKAYLGMPVEGLPENFTCGRVVISQQIGPIHSQSTYILQRPGWIPHFEKTMHKGPVEVGEGMALTICVLPVVMPTGHVGPFFDVWRDEVQAAIAVVVAMLDDRVAQQEVLEDIVVFQPDRRTPMGMLDMAVRVRNFPPQKVIAQPQLEGLQKLALWDSEAQSPVHVAARWYLRAANSGPVADSIVYLWIALEALVPAQGKGKSSDVKGVEDALREAGADPDNWIPSVGRCAGVRAEIVHHGKEQPNLLSQAFYSLEAMVRLLLRDRLDLHAEAWPLNIDDTGLDYPLNELAAKTIEQATTTMTLVHDMDRVAQWEAARGPSASEG